MNESHPSPSAGGQKEEQTETDTKPPQTSPIHTSANQETRSGKKQSEKSEQTNESWGRKDLTQKIFSGFGQYETSWSLVI